MENNNERHARRFALVLVFCAALAFTISLNTGKDEMLSKTKTFDWSKSQSTTASFKIDIPISSIQKLIITLQLFAAQQGYHFTSRRVHPFETWYAIDLWNDKYAISGVNPVQATTYNFAIYVNRSLGGTDEEAKKRLDMISKLTLEFQGPREK